MRVSTAALAFAALGFSSADSSAAEGSYGEGNYSDEPTSAGGAAIGWDLQVKGKRYTFTLSFTHDKNNLPVPKDQADCKGLAPDGIPFAAPRETTFEWKRNSYNSALVGDITGFDMVSVDWMPCGHPPLSSFGISHYDVHFYTIDQQQRNKMVCDGVEGPTCLPGNGSNSVMFYAPVTENMPKGFVMDRAPNDGPGSAVPGQGMHYLNPATVPDSTNAWVTPTTVFGGYNGSVVFFEPMIPFGFRNNDKLTNDDDEETVVYAEIVDYNGTRTVGTMPDSYTVEWNRQTDRVTVVLRGEAAGASYSTCEACNANKGSWNNNGILGAVVAECTTTWDDNGIIAATDATNSVCDQPSTPAPTSACDAKLEEVGETAGGCVTEAGQGPSDQDTITANQETCTPSCVAILEEVERVCLNNPEVGPLAKNLLAACKDTNTNAPVDNEPAPLVSKFIETTLGVVLTAGTSAADLASDCLAQSIIETAFAATANIDESKNGVKMVSVGTISLTKGPCTSTSTQPALSGQQSPKNLHLRRLESGAIDLGMRIELGDSGNLKDAETLLEQVNGVTAAGLNVKIAETAKKLGVTAPPVTVTTEPVGALPDDVKELLDEQEDSESCGKSCKTSVGVGVGLGVLILGCMGYYAYVSTNGCVEGGSVEKTSTNDAIGGHGSYSSQKTVDMLDVESKLSPAVAGPDYTV